MYRLDSEVCKAQHKYKNDWLDVRLKLFDRLKIGPMRMPKWLIILLTTDY